MLYDIDSTSTLLCVWTGARPCCPPVPVVRVLCVCVCVGALVLREITATHGHIISHPLCLYLTTARVVHRYPVYGIDNTIYPNLQCL